MAGRYQIRRVLGRGGMGVVYEAESSWTHRLVALKVLDPERTHRPVHVERFMREARAASALRHPNVVDVLDMGQDPADGALYIVQELLVGEDLRTRIEREGRLSEQDARAVIVPVLKGVAAAHRAGIVHRDIKPANVFLARLGDGDVVPKIIDFGIARDVARDVARTSTGESVGTPAYMAPEQLRAERDITPAADVWALGVTLFEMLSGDKPFPSDNYNVLVFRVLSGDRKRPPPKRSPASRPRSAPSSTAPSRSPPLARYPDADAMLAALDAPATLPPPVASPVAPTSAPSVTPVATVAPRPARAFALPAALSLVALAALAWTLHLRAPSPSTAYAPPRPVAAPSAPASVAALPVAVPAPAAPVAPVAAPPAARVDRPRPHPRVEPVAPSVAAAPDASLGRPRARLLAPGGSYPSP